jgi:hypothetical protein
LSDEFSKAYMLCIVFILMFLLLIILKSLIGAKVI